jgi:fatty-acyl-CoA synthase
MAIFSENPIRNRDDLMHFEAEFSLEQRLPERSVLDVFTTSAERYPESIAIRMLMSGAPDEQPRSVSYRELLDLIRRAANLFASLGGPMPGVAYMLPSLVETHVTLWGAETAGYAVPINFLLQPDSIAGLLKASGAKILVALGPHPQLDIWEKALKLRDLVQGLTLVRVASPGTQAEAGVIDFRTALMAQPDGSLIFGESRGGGDVAAYFHTGGTTGVPKLVAHTHRGQLVAAFGGAVLSDMRSSDILTGTLPLFHVAGTIISGLSAFMTGLELLIMSPAGLRNPAMVKGFWRLVSQYRATIVAGVPTAVGAILEVPLDGADLSAVRCGLTGAALLPPAVSARFREVTGRNLYEVYGMTEASGLITIDPFAGDCGVGSVGWALPYTKVEVRRLDACGGLGELCIENEIGVVTVLGDHVSPGYRDPSHNAAVIVDGTLNTGDLGYKDAQGRLYMAGRSKDLIIRSGHNIDPVMIENAMAAHPAVAIAAAVGMPDPYAGELPVCFIELRADTTVSEDELLEHARRTIDERPAWPKRIYVVAAIPLTTVGKIYKPQLRIDAAQMLIKELLRDQHELSEARVEVATGGPRGLRVTVTLEETARHKLLTIEKALAAYLFEASVLVGADRLK